MKLSIKKTFLLNYHTNKYKIHIDIRKQKVIDYQSYELIVPLPKECLLDSCINKSLLSVGDTNKYCMEER